MIDVNPEKGSIFFNAGRIRRGGRRRSGAPRRYTSAGQRDFEAEVDKLLDWWIDLHKRGYSNCALDYGDTGDEMKLEEIGIVLSVTRERVRQIAVKGITELGPAASLLLGLIEAEDENEDG